MDGNWTICFSSNLTAISLNENATFLANYSTNTFNLIAYNNPTNGRAVWSANQLIRKAAEQANIDGADPVKIIDILIKDVIYWLADSNTNHTLLVPGYWDGSKIYNSSFSVMAHDNVNYWDNFGKFLNETKVPATVVVVTRSGSWDYHPVPQPDFYRNISKNYDIEWCSHSLIHYLTALEEQVNQSTEDIKSVFGYYATCWLAPGYYRPFEPYVDKYSSPYIVSVRIGGICYPSMWDWHTCCWVSEVGDRVLRWSRCVAIDDAIVGYDYQTATTTSWRDELNWKRLRHFAMPTEWHPSAWNDTNWAYMKDYILWAKQNFPDMWFAHASDVAQHAITRRSVEYINGTFSGSSYSLTIKLQNSTPFLPLLFSDNLKSIKINNIAHFAFKDNLALFLT